MTPSGLEIIRDKDVNGNLKEKYRNLWLVLYLLMTRHRWVLGHISAARITIGSCIFKDRTWKSNMQILGNSAIYCQHFTIRVKAIKHNSSCCVCSVFTEIAIELYLWIQILQFPTRTNLFVTRYCFYRTHYIYYTRFALSAFKVDLTPYQHRYCHWSVAQKL